MLTTRDYRPARLTVQARLKTSPEFYVKPDRYRGSYKDLVYENAQTLVDLAVERMRILTGLPREELLDEWLIEVGEDTEFLPDEDTIKAQNDPIRYQTYYLFIEGSHPITGTGSDGYAAENAIGHLTAHSFIDDDRSELRLST